jgi:hypothetical protein
MRMIYQDSQEIDERNENRRKDEGENADTKKAGED